MTLVGPKATKVMQTRAKLEREEGKAYNAEGVSTKEGRVSFVVRRENERERMKDFF